MNVIEREYAAGFFPARGRETDKRDYGRVLIVAGQYTGLRSMAGAAILAARGALRSGAGLVTVCAPDELFTAIHAAAPEVTCMSGISIMQKQPRSDAGSGKFAHWDAIAAGPGLGTDTYAAILTKTLLREYTGTLILDADALNCIAKSGMDLGSRAPGTTIITPHIREARRLAEAYGVSFGSDDPDREELALNLAEHTGAACVLKGHETLIAAPDNPYAPMIVKNLTGNPGMATGGTGDVLAGVIAALAARGVSAWDAACAGVYIHGLAGDLAAKEKGEYGMLASDLADHIPEAILSIT